MRPVGIGGGLVTGVYVIGVVTLHRGTVISILSQREQDNTYLLSVEKVP